MHCATLTKHRNAGYESALVTLCNPVYRSDMPRDHLRLRRDIRNHNSKSSKTIVRSSTRTEYLSFISVTAFCKVMVVLSLSESKREAITFAPQTLAIKFSAIGFHGDEVRIIKNHPRVARSARDGRKRMLCV